MKPRSTAALADPRPAAFAPKRVRKITLSKATPVKVSKAPRALAKSISFSDKPFVSVTKKLHNFVSFQALISKGNRDQSVSTIRSGVGVNIFVDAYETLGVRKIDFLNVIGVPPATFTRKEREGAIMDAGSTERLARIADVGNRATEVFGSTARATEWLRTPNLGLGDQTPFSCLDTDIGGESVRQVLNAIEYGGVV
jgi:putative toxin-antitoxin system antitoxin component (TIGR02293 family)